MMSLDADIFAILDDVDTCGDSWRRVLITQIGLVAVAVTIPAHAAAIRCVDQFSRDLPAMMGLRLP